MIKHTIVGINKVFQTDIHPGSIILVTGTPGTLKTGFTFNVMSEYLKGRKERGIYFTLEETEDSHVRNMKSLGLALPRNLVIVDYTHIRRKAGGVSKSLNIVDVIKKAVQYFYDEVEGKYTFFVLDSLGAVYALYEGDEEKLAGNIYHFFEFLRDLGLTSFIIMERGRFSETLYKFGGQEGFLSDGIIEMGTIEAHHDINIYMQVIKMRACAHSRKKFLIDVGEDGLSILGPALSD